MPKTQVSANPATAPVTAARQRRSKPKTRAMIIQVSRAVTPPPMRIGSIPFRQQGTSTFQIISTESRKDRIARTPIQPAKPARNRKNSPRSSSSKSSRQDNQPCFMKEICRNSEIREPGVFFVKMS